MNSGYFWLMSMTIIGLGISDNTAANPTTTTSAPHPQPAYQPNQNQAYVQHPIYPYGEAYEGYVYPGANYPLQPAPSSSYSSLIPAAQAALQVALKVFAKVGLFLIGGVSLLIVGGIFTTAVCSLTPLCTITFAGLGGIDRESMRSLMTPDKISAAAALVQDAIGKYQRMQRQ